MTLEATVPVISTKSFVWAGQQMMEERDGANTVTKRFYAQGEEINGTAYFYTRDHLGSIREMFTAGGTVVARYDYDPYGRSTTVLETTASNFNFTGLYRHSKSNLDLAMYRAYDPDLGRWLNRDPIAEKGGLNLYRYGRNNPVLWIDKSGLDVIVYSDPLASPQGSGLHATTQIGGRFGRDGFGPVGLYPANPGIVGIFGGRAATSDTDSPNAFSPDVNFTIFKTPAAIDAALEQWFREQTYHWYFLGVSDCRTMSHDILSKMAALMREAGCPTIPYVEGSRRGGPPPCSKVVDPFQRGACREKGAFPHVSLPRPFPRSQHRAIHRSVLLQQNPPRGPYRSPNRL